MKGLRTILKQFGKPGFGLLALWLFMLMFVSPAKAQSPSRADLEAAFVFKFIAYVDWPPRSLDGPDAPFVIGVLGNDPFGRTLDENVAGEKAKGRHIEVRRFSNVSQIDRCHILFIGSSEGGRLGTILDKLRGRSILTVSDLPDFARQGGMIGFISQNNKIRFQINHEAAQQAKLSISAKLLQLAQIVRTNKRQ
jgi:hypothetical protein